MGLLYSSRRALLDGAVAFPWWDPNDEGLCIWSVYQPVGAASFAASLVDLSGNGNNAGDPGGAATPGWTAANGWDFDGIADYLTTTFVPQNDQSQSMLVQHTNAVPSNGYVFGQTDGGVDYYSLRPERFGSVRYRNGAAETAVVPGLASGNLGIAGNRGYRNGIAEGAALVAYGGGAPVASCAIGALNNGGVIGSFDNVEVRAIVLYNCILTAPQMLTVMTAMAAL